MIYLFYFIAIFNLYYILLFIQEYHYHLYSFPKMVIKILKTPFNYLLITPFISLLPYSPIYFILNIGIIIILFFYVIFRIDEKTIIKLKFTKRIFRLIITTLILYTTLYLITNSITNNTWLQIFKILIIYIHPLLVYLSLIITYPIEIVIQKYYVRKARNKIQRIKPIIIGITGSAGKTSTKHFMYQVLCTKYITFMTPMSYNTLNGIAKSINNDMLEGTEIAIIEYGASKKDDIKKMLKLVKPDISIITNIFPQHLETFKTIDNIIHEKTLLLCADTNLYNLDSIYEKPSGKVITYGLSKDADYYINNIEETNKGIKFIFTHKENSKDASYTVSTSIHGKINVMNVLSVICAARLFNFSFKEILNALKHLNPVQNRLEIIKYNDKTIINDSFNSNEKGFLEALEVLKLFPEKRAIITPGIVTGGEYLGLINENVAEEISKVCSRAYIVESVASKYLTKILDKVFFEYHLCKSFKEAYNELINDQTIKTILIENDITDIYKR